MPKLKDSKGVFHKTYRSLYRAEKGYRLNKKPGDLTDSELNDEVTEDFTHEVIGITDRPDNVAPEPKQRENESPGSYFCTNCGEPVDRSMGYCESCGLGLDWSGLE